MAALNTRSGTALYMIGFLWACVNVHTVHLGTHRKRLLFEPANKVLVHHVNEDLLLRALLRHLHNDLQRRGLREAEHSALDHIA